MKTKTLRREFIIQCGLLGGALLLSPSKSLGFILDHTQSNLGVRLRSPNNSEDIFKYIKRIKGGFDHDLYKKIMGAANAFKEGDQIIGIASANEKSREYARTLILNTKISDLNQHSLYEDEISLYINDTTKTNLEIGNWTIADLKQFILTKTEVEIKSIMPSLGSDIIAFLVKTMSNGELIKVGKTVFNPLPNSKIGSKGYLSARVQPNSPTDDIEDIIWQVFNAWAYGVGDLLLGTNPVSSDPKSVAKIEFALHDLLKTFGLENEMPNCVLSHIDVQAEVEEFQPNTTGIWFQSIASTAKANKTFDLSLEKMRNHASKRKGQFGLYVETGQGADATNGHSEGFDMVVHESRKYGFLRGLKSEINKDKSDNDRSWVIVNDVAGFIGPEVFRTKEQLVRCCLEDIAMGKLHGHPIGLDICSTLHMDVSLDDLNWCIDQIMPANPAYLMALPTKNDPMLSYLTTSFSDHVRIREQFGYKVNDSMWAFFKRLDIINTDNKAGEHFGDPIWVYLQYCRLKNDSRGEQEIYAEGKSAIDRIRKRGVPISTGHGKNIYDLDPELEKEVRFLYNDSKKSLWTEMSETFIKGIPSACIIQSESKDRTDYIYHPNSGEKITQESIEKLHKLKSNLSTNGCHFQIIISDGLSPNSLTDEAHLFPILNKLKSLFANGKMTLSDTNIVIKNGRVRAGYSCGEHLFGQMGKEKKGLIHLIGERPGSGHHTYSAYITVAEKSVWNTKGKVDHDITKVISGISDTTLLPELAASEIFKLCLELCSIQEVIGY
jgi:ethanolamine ammonia-lyase large subunit